MDLNSLIQRKRERFEQLEGEIADPRLFDNRKRAEEIMRERANLKDLLEKWGTLETARRHLDDNRELATSHEPYPAQPRRATPSPRAPRGGLASKPGTGRSPDGLRRWCRISERRHGQRHDPSHE